MHWEVLIIQVMLSLILVQAPGAFLRYDGLKLSIYSAFFAILAAGTLGGVIFAGPATLLLVLYCLWVRFVGYADRGAKWVLSFGTMVLAALYLLIQILHLPIRYALRQSEVLIWANIVGILFALCLLVIPLELALLRKKSLRETNGDEDRSVEVRSAIHDVNSSEPRDSSWTLSDSDPAVRAQEGEISLEACPYCEQKVLPDADGRCPACRRPIV